MSLWTFLASLFGPPAPAAPSAPIPPPGSDLLGAATLPGYAQGEGGAAQVVQEAQAGAAGQPDLPDAAIAMVKRWESFRAAPYLCPAGVPTIGYGATAYLTGRKVTMQDPPITETEASVLLRKMLTSFAVDVLGLVKVPLSANELGALTSFAYNVGIGAFRDSTLLRKLNAGDRAGAAAEFARWNKGGGKVLPGLVSRRAEEAALFRAP